MRLKFAELRKFALLFLALSLASLGLGCASDSSGQAPEAMPAPELVVTKALSKDLELNIEYMGQVAGSREVEVRARVGGILLRRNYTEGKYVRQGELMFEIDPEPFKATLEQAKGALAQTEAKLAKARRDLARNQKLIVDGVISRKDYDDAKTDSETTEADVRAAKAKVREAELNLGYTKVTAPISGMTSKETRSEGSLISSTSEASLLTTMTRVDPVYVNFSIPGSDALRYRKGRAEGKMFFSKGADYGVNLLLPDGTLYKQTGAINFLDAQVESTTGVVKARAELPNPDGELMPGQFVRVKLGGLMLKNAMLIPQRCVLQTQQGPIVWVVDESGVVQPRPLTLGVQSGSDYLVEQGLNPGEQVVVEGVIKVRPGMNVRVKQLEAASEAPASPPKPDGV